MKERNIHALFEAGILIKGVNAILECIGGLTLAFARTDRIASLVNRITFWRGIDGRRDFVARHLMAWAQGFSVETQHFFAFYLMIHGVIKLTFVVGLLREKRWAYPFSLAALTAFIAYQLYRYTFTHAVGLLLLSAFDAVVFALVWHEYRLIRHNLPTR